MTLRGNETECKGEYEGFDVVIQQSKTGYYVKYSNGKKSGLNHATDIDSARKWAIDEINKEVIFSNRNIIKINNDIPF